MDMADASAMTEASGLENEPAGAETSSRNARGQEGRSFALQSAAARLSDELRRITIAAPLSSLLMAFILGVFVGRRPRGG